MLTIGEMLRKERERRSLTIADVEQATKIIRKNLEALEQDNWSFFPSKTYITGILRAYGAFLGISQEKLLAFFRREYGKKEEFSFKKHIEKSRTPHTKMIFKYVFAFIVVFFSLYFVYQLKLYFKRPTIEILTPKTAAFKREKKIELKGKVEKESIITVNGERVYQDEDNIFTVSIPLPKSRNEVIIEVVGASGRKTVMKRIFTTTTPGEQDTNRP